MFADTYSPGRTNLLRGLTLVAVILMLITFGMALFYAGTDATQGNVQRIFYMHVGAFSAAATAFFVTVVAGVMYLITRKLAWDKLALAGVEVGLPLATITLITGAIWARPTWNTWWTRDPRLDAMIVLWAVYAAYLTLRATVSAPEQRARFAAVYGILAFVSVIYTTIVIRIRPDTLHPVVIATGATATGVGANSKGEFTATDPRIAATLGIASISWIVAAITLIWYRVRVENLSDRVQALKMRLLTNE